MPKILPNSHATAFLQQSQIPSFIDGDWSTSQASLAVIDPATGASVASVAAADQAVVDQAMQAAHRAFPEWSGMPVAARAACLHRLADKIRENLETLAQLESIDVGKPIENSRGFDIPFGADCFDYFAQLSERASYTTPLELTDIDARVERKPYGPCGFIFPWNFPFTLFCWGTAPALAAGNTVVVKASEVTPLATLYLGKLIKEAGIPDGVINIFTGEGSVCGQPLAEHSLLKHMSFTGSPQIGKLIGKICGERLVPCKLELGGKGAALITHDADLAAAAEGLAAAITLNTGQVCCTATRWFVHASVQDQFTELVSAALQKTNIGSSLDEATQMGPLVSKTQLDRVTNYYQKGLAEGATAVLELEVNSDASTNSGYFLKPHLLTGDEDNICYKEEIFGPTAYIVPFDNEADAVERINRLSYGLANSVWSTDLERANQLAGKLVAGNSWINAHNVFAYGLPYGGVNLSGLGGGVNSPETFYGYLRNQTIARPL
ncbi:aldehyde dehydrogenase family protein [Coraliomargarita sp. SDUM461004]|uniref:Aldehyde dehydrogenase family protein n=1 Tax=Thalassobacterium sedimentorum TaxID=3041258 RepID=A0ABU1AID3_9BACT|nr:aldehyde dehydrogenase family protein [Coraliomargarita sp. SDUM461004]MDQ8194550.1 aldehyde dehydrogenase family protein [Coraliomargarita sp. SDUM461004]